MVTQITWSCPTATCKYIKCLTCLLPANEAGRGVCIGKGGSASSGEGGLHRGGGQTPPPRSRHPEIHGILRDIGKWAGGTHPTGMHSCLQNIFSWLSQFTVSSAIYMPLAHLSTVGKEKQSVIVSSCRPITINSLDLRLKRLFYFSCSQSCSSWWKIMVTKRFCQKCQWEEFVTATINGG